ncbi:MAG: hypothetical protein JSS02_33695 [Planctomycetes bacterium]|nr:hypothetical protein [Planctomycetota bacterium]
MATLRVDSAETIPVKAPRPRRRIPLSLRMFLSLLALAGICSAFVVLRGYRQISAVRAIEKFGGQVYHSRVGPPWLRKLVGEDSMGMFDTVTEVSLYGTVTDADLHHLRGLTALKSLSLGGTQVTGPGLQHLRGLRTLKFLSLTSTNVTDAGLQHLRWLTAITGLSLRGTQVTDAGLEHLHGLTTLEYVDLYGTPVTDAGVAELRQALPSLRIFR